MLTPQMIQDKKFEKAMFGGYDMGQIDQFLDELLGDYTSLYKENATLKAKMRVLVDKIEEYRAVDEEMRKALYTAQKTAKDMTEAAQKQADALLSDARREADKQIAGIRDEIVSEQRRLAEAKKLSGDYTAKIIGLMKLNIEAMEQISEKPAEHIAAEPEPAADKRPVRRQDFEVTIPEDALMRSYGEQQAAPVDEEEEISIMEPAIAGASTDSGMETQMFEIELGKGQNAAGTEEEPDEFDFDGDDGDTAKIYGDTTFTPKPRFDFSDLRFGKGYEEDKN